MIISFVNKKGGTGKTTSAINIGTCLNTIFKQKVLLIDVDPQGNLSYSLGVSQNDCTIGEIIYKREIEESDILSVNNLHIIPSNNDLINYEVEFIKRDYSYTTIKEILSSIKDDYDFILIDCPPTISYLAYNAIIASDAVIIPMQMDVLSLQGLEQMLQTIKDVNEHYNSDLIVLGVLGVLVDERRQLTYEVLEKVRNDYNVNVFNNYIRSNVRAAEAPSHAKSVIEYAPSSNSSKDYKSVTQEIIKILE